MHKNTHKWKGMPIENTSRVHLNLIQVGSEVMQIISLVLIEILSY
jgi:hypothetical protein